MFEPEDPQFTLVTVRVENVVLDRFVRQLARINLPVGRLPNGRISQTCRVCGAAFRARAGSRYCSGRCRMAAHRARRSNDSSAPAIH